MRLASYIYIAKKVSVRVQAFYLSLHWGVFQIFSAEFLPLYFISLSPSIILKNGRFDSINRIGTTLFNQWIATAKKRKNTALLQWFCRACHLICWLSGLLSDAVNAIHENALPERKQRRTDEADSRICKVLFDWNYERIFMREQPLGSSTDYFSDFRLNLYLPYDIIAAR